METSEIKSVLIQRIQDIDDPSFLNALKTITDAKAEEVYRLSDFEKESIREAKQQYTEGKVTSHEIIKQEMEVWLRSK